MPDSAMRACDRNFYRLSIEIPIGSADRDFYKLLPMTPIGERIVLRLKELGEGQRWLAKQIGISQPSISHIIKPKNGKRGRGTAHIVPIAQALKVHTLWLATGKGPKLLSSKGEAILVGKVGAGAEVIGFDDGHAVERGIEPPPGCDHCLCAIIEGDSMWPLEEGWWLFYQSESQGISEKAIGKLSVVGLPDGTKLVKKLKRGSKPGRWRLESWNAASREDVEIAWASPVIDIRPT